MTTLAASPIGSTTATLNGTVNGNGSPIAGYFQYDVGASGTTYSYSTMNNQFFTSGSYYTPQAFSTGISGLSPNTTYHYRMIAFGASEGFGADTNFTTGAGLAAPTLVSPGGGVPTDDVLLSTLAPTFSWNAVSGATGYNLVVALYPNGTVVFSASVSSNSYAIAGNVLASGTPCQWYVNAVDGLGDQSPNSSLLYFETPSVPTALTQGVTNITITTAQLSGFVNPEGLPTSVYFQYDKGTGTNYGTSFIPASPDPSPGTTPENYSQTLTGLTGGSAYHFRFIAINSLGTTYGSTIQFNTSL